LKDQQLQQVSFWRGGGYGVREVGCARIHC
jgi:hypothetical protein